MGKTRRIAAMTALLWAVPAPALAAAEDGTPEMLSWVAGLFMMLFAVILLVAVLRLARVAKGSAVAESVGLVVAAAACLGTSALVGWIARFVEGVSAAQADLAVDLLIVVALVLLVVYFERVRRSLAGFLQGSEALLAKMKAADAEFDLDPIDQE